MGLYLPIMSDWFHRYLSRLTTRQHNAALFLCGVFAALSLPPVYVLPFWLLTVPIWLLSLEQAQTPKRAFVMGWMFGFGYFIAGLYWIAAALFVDIARYWWVLPFAVAGLPVLMAAYWGVASWLLYHVAWRGWPRVVAFAAILTVCEVARGWVFTGFPWNHPGYSWVFYAPMLQSVSLFGVVGLSFITLLLAAAPYVFITRQYPHQRVGFIVTLLVISLGLMAWGYGRLSHQATTSQQAPIVRIVQPNIPQEQKWTPSQLEKQRALLWRLTQSPARNVKAPAMIVWPETAIALIDTMDVRVWQQQVQEKLPADTLLATGVLEADLRPDGQPTFYNGLAVFDRDGVPMTRYAKSHLVPFGEYLPFEKYWPVKPLAVTAGAFSAGNGVETQKPESFPSFSPLICYEVIFPDKVTQYKNRPDFLLNVTNDAWYGTTSGPFQHLAISQTRAVEQGLPLLRAANTGISAVIDAQGRKVAVLNLNQTGFVDTPLPFALKPTLFAVYGRLTWLILIGFGVMVAYVGHRLMQQRPLTVQ
jgi:apolipoprotein N-acyltransferase